MRSAVSLLVCTMAALFLAGEVGCSKYPVDPNGSNTLELESVWQYLKAYSIWQDSIPLASDPFTFATPEQLLASVNDTLHGYTFTKYDSTELPPGMKAPHVVASTSSTSADTTIYVTPLTDSTIWLRVKTQFIPDSTYAEFLTALPTLAKYPKIIIDLRSNGGGAIDAVDSIIEYFLPANTAFIKARYRDYNDTTRTASTIDWTPWTTKHDHSPSLVHSQLAVLVNSGTASASEILTAGLKDGRASMGVKDTATIVGATTFGKGMGQIVISRTYINKRDIKITFLRLEGLSSRTGNYHRKGISPDLSVANSLSQSDAQLTAALHFLEPSTKGLQVVVSLGKSATPDAGAFLRIRANPAFER
jgi:hypothetical protein